MNKIILLDSGPLGFIIHPSKKNEVFQYKQWFKKIVSDNLIYIPEIIDYESRRELIRSKLTESIERLDDLKNLKYVNSIPITKEIFVKAAELWAWSRNTGQATAEDTAIDIDVILAATAIITSQNEGKTTIIVTTNVKHLQRYHTDTKHWQDEYWFKKTTQI
ncbi:MAG: type II toxin-antitoxin system VapC family toxin [Nostoc sp.]